MTETLCQHKAQGRFRKPQPTAFVVVQEYNHKETVTAAAITNANRNATPQFCGAVLILQWEPS